MRFKLFAAVFLVSGLAAHAATITYTETVTATGSLNNVAFTNALLTLQATVDSNTITSRLALPGLSTKLLFIAPTLTFGGTVSGLGAFTLPAGQVFDNQYGETAGLGTTVQDIVDVTNPFFSTYDLKSATALLTGGTFSNLGTYATVGSGNLTLSSVAATSTFQAQVMATTVTPEPSGFALLTTGLVGIGGLLRKRLA